MHLTDIRKSEKRPEMETKSGIGASRNGDGIRNWDVRNRNRHHHPVTFRLLFESPSTDQRRRSTSGQEATDMDISPSVHFRDLPWTSVWPVAVPSPPATKEPAPSSGLKEKELELSQEQSGLGRTVEEDPPRRRSLKRRSQNTL